MVSKIAGVLILCLVATGIILITNNASMGDDLVIYRVTGHITETKEAVKAVFVPYGDMSHLTGVVRECHGRLYRVEATWCGKGMIETILPDGKRAEFTVR